MQPCWNKSLQVWSEDEPGKLFVDTAMTEPGSFALCS